MLHNRFKGVEKGILQTPLQQLGLERKKNISYLRWFRYAKFDLDRHTYILPHCYKDMLELHRMIVILFSLIHLKP